MKMSEARQARSQYQDGAESESLLSSTASPFEPSSHPHPLLLCDLSHLQQPAPSNYQQQQQHKGCSYFAEDEDDDDDEEDEDSKQGSSSRRINSPFSPHCRIPLPDFTFNGYTGGGGGLLLAHHLDTGTFIRRRNERERTRVRNVNEGFERLRAHLPPLYASPTPVSSNGASRAAGGAREGGGRKSSSSSSSSTAAATAASSTAESRRLSKVETLRLAIAYIKQLQEALRC